MSAISKFPTKSRLMVFEAKDSGRWVCDGRFAFFCEKPMLSNTELAMEPAVYTKFKGDMIHSSESLPPFDKLEERGKFASIPAEYAIFNGGNVMVRFNERYPDELKGDNYVIRYKLPNTNEEKHMYLPDKILKYIEEMNVGTVAILVSEAYNTLVFIRDETEISDLDTGVITSVNERKVIGIYNAERPIYDAINIL